MSLYEEIIFLINSKCEGEYWDFKQQWPNKCSLLHDIICLSNNLLNRDAYLIIGVEDDSFFVKGVEDDDKNRKNTQQLTDLLKDKPFAGDVRPSVEVRTITMSGKNVDVIIIKNNSRPPIYLTKDVDGLKCAHIYTRIQDTNTPREKTADIDKTEILWRKRFGIDKSPLERVALLLEDEEKWMNLP